MTRTSWISPLEGKRVESGHWHIEGFCAVKMGRLWSIKQEGCQGRGTDNPNEAARYRSSLAMVEDAIRVTLNS